MVLMMVKKSVARPDPARAAKRDIGAGTGVQVVPSRSMAQRTFNLRLARESMAWMWVLPSVRLRS